MEVTASNETNTLAVNGNGAAHIPMSSGVDDLIHQALCNKDIDVERFERLLDFQERILDKQAERAFNADRAKMQAELPSVYKSKKNAHTRSSYAALGDINKVILPIVNKFGFSISYCNEAPTQPNHVRIKAILAHCDGHQASNVVEMPYDNAGAKGNTNKTPIQASASAMTYAQRYALCGLLSITLSDDDHDGNRMLDNGFISATEVQVIEDLIERSNADKQAFLEAYGISEIKNMKNHQFKNAEMKLLAKINNRK